MSVTKVKVNGMDMSSDVTLSGTTPTLTIGDAGAEDADVQAICNVVFTQDCKDNYAAFIAAGPF